ncbi:igE-binding protein-like [Gordionus sp. m RMFG-2023]|uniref:igE-binding protein-like n=1 Tax=Gordionus sp. m RMFG-2023 TaxID=3053472 RepID=UPI0031FE14D9
MQNTSADTMIKRLKKWFARFGIPKYIVSDNGPQFLSGEFRRYCDLNNIRHICSAPYHPKTNGLAEHTVRTLKGRYYATRDSISDPEEAMTQEREFKISQPIWLNNENTHGWKEGIIKERIGLYSYIVESSGKTLRKHADQLRNRLVIPNHESSLEVTEMVVPVNEANTNTNTNTTLRCSSRNRKPTKRFIEEI